MSRYFFADATLVHPATADAVGIFLAFPCAYTVVTAEGHEFFQTWDAALTYLRTYSEAGFTTSIM